MRLLFILLMIAAFCIPVSRESAGEEPLPPAKKIVKAVEIKQNKAVSESFILSKIKTKVGSEFSQNIANEDLKRLYATGQFRDIKIDLSDYDGGLKVTFIVIEKEILREIKISGNRAFKKKRIESLVKSKAGEVLDRRQVKEDAKEIAQFYAKKGFSRVKVEDEIKVDEATNEARLYISIDEGKKIRIKKITIEGNEEFNDKKILKVMTAKRRTLIRSGFFKKDTFDVDIEKIIAMYKRAGYMDVQAEGKLDYDTEPGKLLITIKVLEGRKYLTGDIVIKGNKIFSKDDIIEKLNMKSGSVFSQDNIRRDISSIQGYYFENGYINAEIKSDTTFNKDTERVDITYDVTENELVYVNKLIIKGNVKTKDAVIRREMKIVPGEHFDGKKLRRSKENLYNLGFFEEVTYDTEPTAVPDKQDMIVNVKEAKTGELSFGAGYSTVQDFVGFAEIKQNNFDLFNFPTFTGGGQNLKLRGEVGTVRKDYELSFTEPWIFDRPVSFGFDLYKKTISESESFGYGYDEKRQGGVLRLGKALGEWTKGDIAYRLEEIDISNIPEDASADFKLEEGSNTIKSVALLLSKDTRDNIFNPTTGWVRTGSVEVAGGPFGGDKDFVKYIGTSAWYFPMFGENVLELKLRAGIVDGFSDSPIVPIYERFYAGGANTIRGYRERRIGPKDPNTDDPIGGESMFVGNAEYLFPIMKSLKGAVFCDIGNVWPTIEDFGEGSLKSSVGVGVRMKTPIGPLKLDWGYGLDKDTRQDDTGRFHFSMSYGF